MNDLVYPVHGGLEDWGYAASWDTAFVKPCTPHSYGGYAAAKTASYPDAAIRSFTILIETSDAKSPPANTYGGPDGVYGVGGAADGHVPRNVRLALSGIDLVRPFVEARLLAADAACAIRLSWAAWGAVHVDAARPVCRAATAGAPWVACGEVQSGDGVWGASSSPLHPKTYEGCATVPAELRAASGGVVEIAV